MLEQSQPRKIRGSQVPKPSSVLNLGFEGVDRRSRSCRSQSANVLGCWMAVGVPRGWHFGEEGDRLGFIIPGVAEPRWAVDLALKWYDCRYPGYELFISRAEVEEAALDGRMVELMSYYLEHRSEPFGNY